MSSTSHLWVTECNKTTQTIVTTIGTMVGLLLILFSRLTEESSIGTSAALMLGIVLLLAGLGFLILSPKQTITVNSKLRSITIENKNRFTTTTNRFRFEDIVDSYVEEIGDNEGGRASYHIVLRLKSGKSVSLFTGFFEGSYSKLTTENRCRRLMDFIKVKE